MSDNRTAADLVPITVLTGFLGSGKTTLLNVLLAHPDLADAAVLINEFGEVGLDHHLVRAVKDDIVLLNSGCLCCTVRGDLVTALRDLWLKRVRGDVPEFRRVVIETTGLADPAPILHTLMTDPLLSARYRLDGIVTTVDVVHADGQLAAQPEAARQVAVADRLVLTKTDLVETAALETLTERLRALNPGAPLVTADHGAVEPAALLDAGLFNTRTKHPDVEGWLHAEAVRGSHDHHHDHDHHGHGHEHGHGHDPNRHDAHVGSFVISFEKPLHWDMFVQAMDVLIAAKGGSILRLKGILNVEGEDRPVVVHGVQHVFHPPAALPEWPDADHRSRLVFITRDLGRPAVAKLLSECLLQPSL